jgi:hypothetical protein
MQVSVTASVYRVREVPADGFAEQASRAAYPTTFDR